MSDVDIFQQKVTNRAFLQCTLPTLIYLIAYNPLPKQPKDSPLYIWFKTSCRYEIELFEPDQEFQLNNATSQNIFFFLKALSQTFCRKRFVVHPVILWEEMEESAKRENV